MVQIIPHGAVHGPFFQWQNSIQWPIATGIPQGSPASPILFLLYLHRLFDSLQLHHPNIWSPSYIDNVALVAQGKTREGNSRALEAMARTAFQWARDNPVAFDDAKLEMLHFHHSRQETASKITTATATPPCDLHNHHRSHRFFHRIRIRHTQLRTSVNFQSVTRRFRRLSSRN
jgi:hypothetical protein